MAIPTPPQYWIYPVTYDWNLTSSSGSGRYNNKTVITSLGKTCTECFMIIEHPEWDRNGANIFPLPCYPDNINESQVGNWSEQSPLGRSSPISAFTGTSYREISLNLKLHREMCNGDEQYIDNILIEMRRSVYPHYIKQGLMPPLATFQFGEFRCKGYVKNVSFNWQKPIIDGNYQVCDVSLSVVDVPDSVKSASDISKASRKPTNPFDWKPIKSSEKFLGR